MLAIATCLLLAACGSTTVTPSAVASPSPTRAATSASPVAPSSSEPVASAAATANTTGFAFAAEDIAAYYQTQGYTCAAPQPSTKAAGFTLRSCEKTDDAGRTRVIGLVTDPAGGLANAFGSVKGKETETILAPIDALDPLSGFLGATLGVREAGPRGRDGAGRVRQVVGEALVRVDAAAGGELGDGAIDDRARGRDEFGGVGDVEGRGGHT